jgi:YebC/PmpR family DNA-binding regulatory protein
MAGHSHWAGIKHRKGAADKKRGKLFSKLARNIITAARSGGGDPEMNLKLRYALDKARLASMPKDNIERAVKKGTGELEGSNFEEVMYEGYGPGGIAIILEGLTDNRHRTAGEVRNLFERRGGKMGESGSVSFLFDKKAVITVPVSGASEDDVMAVALDAGADDMKRVDDAYEILASPTELESVRKALIDKKLEVRSAEFAMIPKASIPVDASTGRKLLALIEVFEDHEDIQNVYSNYDMPEEVMAQLASEAEEES